MLSSVLTWETQWWRHNCWYLSYFKSYSWDIFSSININGYFCVLIVFFCVCVSSWSFTVPAMCLWFQLEFYGPLPWAVMLRVTLPLAIFHRFHSTVVLAEVWKASYRLHQEWLATNASRCSRDTVLFYWPCNQQCQLAYWLRFVIFLNIVLFSSGIPVYCKGCA